MPHFTPFDSFIIPDVTELGFANPDFDPSDTDQTSRHDNSATTTSTEFKTDVLIDPEGFALSIRDAISRGLFADGFESGDAVVGVALDALGVGTQAGTLTLDRGRLLSSDEDNVVPETADAAELKSVLKSGRIEMLDDFSVESLANTALVARHLTGDEFSSVTKTGGVELKLHANRSPFSDDISIMDPDAWPDNALLSDHHHKGSNFDANAGIVVTGGVELSDGAGVIINGGIELAGPDQFVFSDETFIGLKSEDILDVFDDRVIPSVDQKPDGAHALLANEKAGFEDISVSAGTGAQDHAQAFAMADGSVRFHGSDRQNAPEELAEKDGMKFYDVIDWDEVSFVEQAHADDVAAGKSDQGFYDIIEWDEVSFTDSLFIEVDVF